MILFALFSLVAISSATNGDVCEEMLTKEQCSNAAVADAVGRITSKQTNPIVASAMMEALEENEKMPASNVAFAHSPAVGWLCDSAFIKSGSKAVVASSFCPGKTCKVVTDNIRGLVRIAKVKEISVQGKVNVKHREMINTNNVIVQYVSQRNRITALRNQASQTYASLRSQMNSYRNAINQLHREIADLQRRINNDGWNNWWRNLFNIYDAKKAQLRSKVNYYHRLNSALSSTHSQLNAYQRQINQLIVNERNLQTRIRQQDQSLKLLGAQLTDLKVHQNNLGLIATEWTTVNEKCEDIEDDPVLFEDLTGTVNHKVEAQATKLSTLICNDV